MLLYSREWKGGGWGGNANKVLGINCLCSDWKAMSKAPFSGAKGLVSFHHSYRFMCCGGESRVQRQSRCFECRLSQAGFLGSLAAPQAEVGNPGALLLDSLDQALPKYGPQARSSASWKPSPA